jgi:capsular polysaccharide biosynthesis protein
MPDPEKPVKPIMLVNVVLAVAGGFILALIYAFSADHFDHTFKGVDDAERYLGVPVLASIPKLGRRMIRAKRGA